MKHGKSLIPVLLLILLASAYLYQRGLPEPPGEADGGEEPGQVPETPQSSIRIAAFNIQVFGRTKRSNPEVMEVLVDIAQEFDVILVQEIRDSSGETAPEFLSLINAEAEPDYMYVESVRLGRSTSKESYAYFWNTGTVHLVEGSAYVYNDTADVFEREPFIASFRSGGFDFTLVGIHTKPDDAYNEIGNLTVVVGSILLAHPEEGDVIVLGDFNADGDYFDEEGGNPFKQEGYHWVVGNDFDTMTKTSWTYDRVVLLDGTLGHEYVEGSCAVFYFDDAYGLSQSLTEDVSDHYPVYAEFRTSLPDDD